MKIGVGQIIFMRAGAHQRMDYCWRTFEGDRWHLSVSATLLRT